MWSSWSLYSLQSFTGSSSLAWDRSVLCVRQPPYLAAFACVTLTEVGKDPNIEWIIIVGLLPNSLQIWL